MRGDGPQGPFATASNMALLSALLFCTGSIFQVWSAANFHARARGASLGHRLYIVKRF